MNAEDKMIMCSDCNSEFVHSVADQERYAQRGFTNDPKRCPTCREKKRRTSSDSRGNTGGGGGGGGYRGGYGGGGGMGGSGARAPREMHSATCAECGQPTQVPFAPKGNRPVYCRNCFQARRARGEA